MNPWARSRLQNCLTPLRPSRASSIRGNGYASLFVCIQKPVINTESQLPSFFLTRTAAIFLPNKDYWGCIKTGSLSDDALIKLLLNVIPHFWPLVQWYSLVWNSKWFVVCSEDEDDLGFCDLVKHKIVTKGSLIPVNDLLQTLLLRFCLVAYLHPAQNSIGFCCYTSLRHLNQLCVDKHDFLSTRTNFKVGSM